MLFFIIPYIFVTALINKASNITHSVSTGAKIGVLAGIFYFAYLSTYFLYLQASNPETYYEGGFGIIIPLSAFFTAILVTFSIVGMLISYFIRKVMKKST